MNIVQYKEGPTINTIITSREEILATCKELVAREGLPSVNIRTAAKMCSVSVGTIYNYFPSKTELLTAIIQEVWKDIFSKINPPAPTCSFSDYVSGIFTGVRLGMREYPDFFMHSMQFTNTEKEQGRNRMEECFTQIKTGMLEVLQQDKSVRPEAFSDTFSVAAFVDFVFENLLMLFMTQTENCSVLAEVIRRTIY